MSGRYKNVLEFRIKGSTLQRTRVVSSQNEGVNVIWEDVPTVGLTSPDEELLPIHQKIQPANSPPYYY